jgi:CDP-diacylglycerol---serine O-phosphatidyltransferase
LFYKELHLNSNVKAKGIYFLPNLLTTMGLFAGFFAIISAINGNFSISAYAIFIAMLLDGLDGRVARLTGTESAFGGEFDSLADMVSFGVGPALVMYSWSYSFYGKLGWAISFLYVAAVALRLAKFNSQEQDKNFFKGLPSPAGAASMMSFLWVIEYYELNNQFFSVLSLVFGVIVALLMISNVPYASFKAQDVNKKISWFYAFLIVAAFCLIAVAPAIIVFLSFMIYILSGVFIAFNKKSFIKRIKKVTNII